MQKQTKCALFQKTFPQNTLMLFYIFSCNKPVGNIEKVLKESDLSSQDAVIVEKNGRNYSGGK